jgi:hypothetical protein
MILSFWYTQCAIGPALPRAARLDGAVFAEDPLDAPRYRNRFLRLNQTHL